MRLEQSNTSAVRKSLAPSRGAGDSTHLLGVGHVAGGGTVSVARREAELDAVVGLLMQSIIHAADIQDRDGGVLLMGALFGLYPFLLPSQQMIQDVCGA